MYHLALSEVSPREKKFQQVFLNLWFTSLEINHAPVQSFFFQREISRLRFSFGSCQCLFLLVYPVVFSVVRWSRFKVHLFHTIYIKLT